MNYKYYSETKIINGATTVGLMPESQRPTYNQFYYYCSKHITEQEKDLIKTSAAEQRNNKRLLTSDSLHGVYGPGDMVEIDACEADVSLVSSADSNKTIGRPIVYFMIDVYTRAIIAMSVAFDNNSILGVTNLFLNLADNKKNTAAVLEWDLMMTQSGHQTSNHAVYVLTVDLSLRAKNSYVYAMNLE